MVLISNAIYYLVQKLIKKCSEFPIVYEQYKVPFGLCPHKQNDREERLTQLKQSIEEEKEQIDQSYRRQAQVLKCEFESKMLELES